MKKLTVIVYHYIRPVKRSKYPNLKALEIEIFKKHLNYLSRKYSIISYEELIDFLKNKKNFENPCMLTFDDGYKDHLQHVIPELKKRNIKGFFFPSVEPILKKNILNVNKLQFVLEKQKKPSVIFKDILNILLKKKFIKDYEIKKINKISKKFTNRSRPYDNKNVAFLKYLLQEYFSENIINYCCNYLFKKYVSKNEEKFSKSLYMSLADLKKIDNLGMYVGAHGFSHKHFTKLNSYQKNSEIRNNLQFLKKFKLYKKNWIMCYPYGSYDAATIRILKKYNCCMGLTIRNGINLLRKKENFYNLKRIDAKELNKYI